MKAEEMVQLIKEVAELLVNWEWFDWIYEKNDEEFRSFESYVLNNWSMSSLRNDIYELTVVNEWLDTDEELRPIKIGMIEDCIRKVLFGQYHDYKYEKGITD